MIVAVGKFETGKLIDDIIKISCGENELHENNKSLGEFRHADGWGIAYMDDAGKWNVYRSTKPIFEDKEIPRFRDISCRALILHTRRATKGRKDIVDNNMPFLASTDSGDYLFTHNGTIEDKFELDQSISAKGDSDSVSWFNYLLSNARCSTQKISTCMFRPQKFSSANFFFVTPDKIVVGERFRQNPEYYTMKLYQDNESLIISSEVLPTLKEKPWKKIENNSFIEIDYKSENRKVSGFHQKDLSQIFFVMSRSLNSKLDESSASSIAVSSERFL